MKIPKIFPLVGTLCLSLMLLGHSHAQSTATASGVNPIVDPLSEMTPAGQGETNDGILDMDIENLGGVDAVVSAFDIEVSSVSKQDSTIGKSPAAVYVITQEMIHRSGATCIPEALRMAPGVTVCQVNAYDWTVSIRGGNDYNSNKLLVMVDGRSVYCPIFSGVFWSFLDMPLDDIQRIEVIRGPGGTLWGDNAVNGVINIITKTAQDTQGTYATSGGGNMDHNISTVRYGGKLSEHAKFNIWGKYRDGGPESASTHDHWHQGRGGFRVDWNPRGSEDDRITTQGNFFGGEEGYSMAVSGLPFPYEKEVIGTRPTWENSLQLRWEHTIDDESDWAFQTYYDQTGRQDPLGNICMNTFCADFQHRFPLGEHHSVIWGTEYRRIQSYTSNDYEYAYFDPAARLTDMTSWFVQDEIEVIKDKFNITIGTKLENNSYTGFEYQPSVRGLWQFDDRHVMWGAVSRTVRTPSLLNENGNILRYNGTTGTGLLRYALLTPDPNIKSEEAITYEWGYRTQQTKRFAWDVALFCNVYRNLMSYTSRAPDVDPPYLFVPFVLDNNGHGTAYGCEWTASWEATENWKLAGSYSYLFHKDFYDVPPGSFLIYAQGNGVFDPRNQVRLQSYWNFAPRWQLDAFFRYVDTIAPTIPGYITMDLRLGWRPTKNLEFSIVGQNLFDAYHLEMLEFPAITAPGEAISRTVFAKVTWTR